MHQNEWFQVLLFKNSLWGLTEPPLQTPLRFFSGFALVLGFTLNPQAPSTRASPRFSGALRPLFGHRPQLLIGELGFAPK